MSYDWEKIFTDKSKDELFEIYSGNSFLPNETIIYAKQELERRGFVFDKNIEHNNYQIRLIKKLSNLISESESSQHLLEVNKRKIIPYKNLYFLIPGIIILHIVLLKIFSINLTIIFPIIMIGTTIWYVLFTNRIYAKQKAKQNKRLEKIIELKAELERNVSAERLDTIKNQINRNIDDDNKIKVLLSYISIGFVLIFLIIKIILFFIRP